MREYAIRFTSHPVSCDEVARVIEVTARGGSPRIALGRGMNLFAFKVGARRSRYGGSSSSEDYQLSLSQRLTIDIVRVKPCPK